MNETTKTDGNTYKFFHDSHFLFDVVECICFHIDSFSPQTCFVHHFHRVHLVIADIKTHEDLREGSDADFLHNLILVDPLLAADFS